MGGADGPEGSDDEREGLREVQHHGEREGRASEGAPGDRRRGRHRRVISFQSDDYWRGRNLHPRPAIDDVSSRARAVPSRENKLKPT